MCPSMSKKPGAAASLKFGVSNAPPKVTADGLVCFQGGEFDDWFKSSFMPFLKRKKLAGVLDFRMKGVASEDRL